jgi:nucleoid-associated protein YgaU
MVLRSHSGIGFWLFLVLVAVGAGWAANQEWRWPLPALFGPQSDPDDQVAATETAAPQQTPEQPSVEQTVAGTPMAEDAVSEQSAAPASDALAEAPPAESQSEVADETVSEPPAALASDALAEGPPAGRQSEQESPPQQVTLEAAPEPAAGPASSETETSAPPGVEVAAIEPPAPDPDAPVAVKPSFDLVRVEPDGRAVIAGRAEPGAEVELRSGTEVIDRVRASRRGEWIAIPGKPLSPGDQELTAVAARGDAPELESEQVVVIAVPEPRSPLPQPGPAKNVAEARAAAQPVAVLLDRNSRGKGRVLQAPGRLSAEGTLALMTVSYDEGGKILLSGEAPPGVPVRIYVDNRPAALVVGDAKGAWSSGLDQALEPGTYTLRLDQLDAKGQAVARIETPFTRVSEPPIPGQLQVDYVVVQPGNSLWRIARRLSGKGLDYVYIYGVNQGQIRNPDLIYPGQVFEIPSEIGVAG